MWNEALPGANGTVHGFSALCWYTGVGLYEQLAGAVPVGLLAGSVGGSPIEFWLPPGHVNDTAACGVDEPPCDPGGPNGYTDSEFFERLIQLTAVAARSEPSEAVDVVEEALFNARCSAQALRALAVLAPVSGLASSTLEELMREVLQGTGGGRTGGAGGLSGAELSGVCWAVQHLGAADSATAAKLVEVSASSGVELQAG